jgi:hypothetical protein
LTTVPEGSAKKNRRTPHGLTMIEMLLNRIGPVAATRRGLRIVGGRRPWKALQLQSCIETV